MDWRRLPLEPLEAILDQLEFKDRLDCSQVCQSWNVALFSCPTLTRKIVFRIGPNCVKELRSAIRTSNRSYRQLAITLNDCWESDINACVEEAAQRWDIQFVSLVGEPSKVLECFQWNSTMFSSITELRLEFTMDQVWPVISAQELVLKQLKKFHFLQVYMGHDQVGLLFRLKVPKLELASVVLDSLANEEAMYWDDPLIELEGCTNLKSLEVDLNNTMWESFFSVQRPHMERLEIRRASDELQERDWDQLFQNMPNLRQVELSFTNDVMLSSVTRNCRLLERLQLNGFCLHDGVFASSMNLPRLKQLHMDGWLIGALFSKENSLELISLQELTWKYVELAPAQGSFTIIAPNLVKIILRGCDYQRFLLEAGPRLESLDMDYYRNQVVAPNFFYSLEHLTQLALHIDCSSLKVAEQISNVSHLKRLELICSTEKSGYDCDALFGSFCTYCPELEELTLRNEHENVLSIGYEYFAQLSKLTKLKVLTLQYITLHSVTGVIRMERLLRLNVWGCTVSGDGAQGNIPLMADGLKQTQSFKNESVFSGN